MVADGNPIACREGNRFFRRPRTGFTLIELLIVVAIIAILAAIAVPNLLEAEVRAKVSRAKADMQAVATGLEAYRVDANAYPPNDGVYNVLPIQLTTPVAFLSSTNLIDPFRTRDVDPVHGELVRYYSYLKVVGLMEMVRATQAGYPPPVEAVDYSGFNPGAFEKYGRWRLVSVGPDRAYSDRARFAAVDPVVLGSDIPYDPTNGTTSWGNLLRTQKSAEETRLAGP